MVPLGVLLAGAAVGGLVVSSLGAAAYYYLRALALAEALRRGGGPLAPGAAATMSGDAPSRYPGRGPPGQGQGPGSVLGGSPSAAALAAASAAGAERKGGGGAAKDAGRRGRRRGGGGGGGGGGEKREESLHFKDGRLTFADAPLPYVARVSGDGEAAFGFVSGPQERSRRPGTFDSTGKSGSDTEGPLAVTPDKVDGGKDMAEAKGGEELDAMLGMMAREGSSIYGPKVGTKSTWSFSRMTLSPEDVAGATLAPTPPQAGAMAMAAAAAASAEASTATAPDEYGDYKRLVVQGSAPREPAAGAAAAAAAAAAASGVGSARGVGPTAFMPAVPAGETEEVCALLSEAVRLRHKYLFKPKTDPSVSAVVAAVEREFRVRNRRLRGAMMNLGSSGGGAGAGAVGAGSGGGGSGGSSSAGGLSGSASGGGMSGLEALTLASGTDARVVASDYMGGFVDDEEAEGDLVYDGGDGLLAENRGVVYERMMRAAQAASVAACAAAERLPSFSGMTGAQFMAAGEAVLRAGRDVEGESGKHLFEMKRGVVHVFPLYAGAAVNEANAESLFPVPGDALEFFADMHKLHSIVTDGPVKTFCHRRLMLMEQRFRIHLMLNSESETNAQKRVPHRDFYNVRKVDTHVHHSSCMNQKHLLRFIKKKMKVEPGTPVAQTPDGRNVTLTELFAQLGLSSYDLSIDTLDMHTTMHDNTFHRFDKFNNKYNPAGQSKLREIFIKSDNHIEGRYLAEVTKEVLEDLEESKYQMAEYRVSVYGRKMSEWGTLAAWFCNNELYSDNARWLVQVPRLYNIYKATGAVACFQDMLDNIFLPLFEVTNDPMCCPQLATLLQQIVGFDMVDDESKPERRPGRDMPTPEEWDIVDNPAFTYYGYYLYANLYVLNLFRESKGLNTFAFRPHSGEAGDADHLAGSFLFAHNINHGINLRKSPALQYLYYLSQVGLAVSPLSNNSLFLDFHRNPFPTFFARGLNVSLSTDDPLQIHLTKEPLVEEYSVAAQMWKFSACDLCEVARNSVLQSGYEHQLKMRWVGERYYLPGPPGNEIAKTNVPNVRLRFRYESWCDEVNFVVATGTSALDRARARLTTSVHDPDRWGMSSRRSDRDRPGYITTMSGKEVKERRSARGGAQERVLGPPLPVAADGGGVGAKGLGDYDGTGMGSSPGGVQLLLDRFNMGAAYSPPRSPRQGRTDRKEARTKVFGGTVTGFRLGDRGSPPRGTGAGAGGSRGVPEGGRHGSPRKGLNFSVNGEGPVEEGAPGGSSADGGALLSAMLKEAEALDGRASSAGWNVGDESDTSSHSSDADDGGVGADIPVPMSSRSSPSRSAADPSSRRDRSNGRPDPLHASTESDEWNDTDVGAESEW